jgi:hypothetical protein
VILIDALPQPDVGAPVPVLVADEDRVALAYVARARSPDGWNGAARGTFPNTGPGKESHARGSASTRAIHSRTRA